MAELLFKDQNGDPRNYTLSVQIKNGHLFFDIRQGGVSVCDFRLNSSAYELVKKLVEVENEKLK